MQSSNLKYYREKFGITQRKLSDDLNITETSIQMYERGRIPRPRLMKTIADYFGVTVDEMWFRAYTPKRNGKNKKKGG